MLQKLKEWNDAFPGKIYIHENVMKQGFEGNFQHGTASYLEDLKILHSLGIQGICFEAFEPGYGAFAQLFETLSRAMLGEEIRHELTEAEKACRKNHSQPFSPDRILDLTPYISDPVLVKCYQFHRQSYIKITPQFYRDYVSFALEHKERLDYLYIGFRVARNGVKQGTLRFKDLSPEAGKFLNSRKLWDFMEDIPVHQDPRAATLAVVEELLKKVY